VKGVKKHYELALPTSIDLVIPGYERSYPPGVFKVLSPVPRDSGEWYRQFVTKVDGAIGRRFFPVCRMGDGVLMFAVGRGIPSIRGSQESLGAFGRRRLMSLLYRGRDLLRGGADFNIGMAELGFAEYSSAEWRSMRPVLAAALREVSQIGCLCPVLSYRDNQFAQQYFVPFVRWLRRNGITLNMDNYYPFYFVYALLNGPDRGKILGRKRILVVTTLDRDKVAKIGTALKQEGAESVQFLNVTKSRTMLDELNLESVDLPVDVCLLASGLGTARLLLQLKKTETLCLDAGWAMEAIADPGTRRSRGGARSFCWADFERNGDFTPI
jgi:hypothetical protein